MRNIFYPLSLLTLLVSCSDKPQISKKDQIQNELKAQREFVVGNFRDSKIRDTVFVELVDAKTLKYVLGKLDPDAQTNMELLVKRDTKLQMVCADQKVLISDYEQVIGASLFENLGDLNNDGLDEIGFVWEAEDFSMLNTYYIYQFRDGKLMEVFHFDIRDEMLSEQEPFIKKTGDKTFSCRVYDPEAEQERAFKEFQF